MPRNVTLTFADGTTHQYQNVPDDVSPDAVISRASNQFKDKQLTKIDGGNKPERSWGDTALSFAGALPGAVYRTAKAVGDAVTNPTETLGTLGHLVIGGLDKFGQALGNAPLDQMPNMPPERAQSINQSSQLVDALADKYKQNYGSVAGFKEMLATHPEDLLLDVSTLAGGGAGLMGKSATGNTMANIARYTNPLSAVELPLNAVNHLGAKAVGLAADTLGGRRAALDASKIVREAAGPDLNIIRLANKANPDAPAAQAAAGVSGDAYQALANRGINLNEVASQLAKDQTTLQKFPGMLPNEKFKLLERIEGNRQIIDGTSQANSIINSTGTVPKIPTSGVTGTVSKLLGGRTKVYLANEAIQGLSQVLKQPTLKAIQEGMKTGKSANELMSMLPTIEQNKLLQYLTSNPQYLTKPQVAAVAQVEKSSKPED